MDNLEVSKALYKGFPLPSYAWKWMENDFYLIDCNDAAELRTTTVELRAHESLFSAIVNGISEAVVAVDTEGRNRVIGA